MNKRLLYKIAYRKLNSLTPLKTDCGMLCERACCKGDNEKGMYLFPGEEIMLAEAGSSLKTSDTASFHSDNRKVRLAVCNGECQRSLRPLACRIFPLTPYLSIDNIFEIKMDPRAVPLCPIALHSTKKEINSFFVRAVRDVFLMLFKDGEIKNYVYDLSRVLDEAEKFSLLLKVLD